MSKKSAVRLPEPTPTTKDRLAWPTHLEELGARPRSFRIHRLNAHEWQAYVTEDGAEFPIGKPDLFELVEHKVKSIMKMEGQQEFLAAKQAAHASA